MSDVDRYFQKLHEMIALYRGFGFLTTGRFAGKTINDTVVAVEAAWTARLAEITKRPGYAWSDVDRSAQVKWMEAGPSVDAAIELLKCDVDRCWAFDQESVYGSEQFYAYAVARLARLSCGALEPVEIHEHWPPADEYGARIEVSFTARGRRHRFWIAGHGDFMNLGVIAGINAIIDHPTHRIAIHGCGQDKVAIWIDDGTRAALRKHGWRFEDLTPTQGVLQLPDPGLASPCGESMRELLFIRGEARYREGDVVGAWSDWEKATKLRMPDIHSRIKAVTASRE